MLFFLFILIWNSYLLCGEKPVRFNRACDSCIWHTSQKSNFLGITAEQSCRKQKFQVQSSISWTLHSSKDLQHCSTKICQNFAKKSLMKNTKVCGYPPQGISCHLTLCISSSTSFRGVSSLKGNSPPELHVFTGIWYSVRQEMSQDFSLNDLYVLLINFWLDNFFQIINTFSSLTTFVYSVQR